MGTAPARLGRYELLARLATGGMGEIFLARLEGAAGFEKLFVVKRILPHLADDARFRQMLISEARLASKLSHANICQVYELGEEAGQLYIVMEYLEGITLLPLLRKASKEQFPLEFGLIAAVIQQTTDALHYAHELTSRDGEHLGLVHRDVSPSNIFLTESGVAKILDFGIAKVKDASANTQTGTVKGKYAYMAPEQLRGGTLDRRADVFALGVVVYEMIALRRLFQRSTDYLTFRALMEQPVPDIRRYRPDIPEALAQVLATALERDPSKRYGSARQLGAAMLDAVAPTGRIWTQGEISDRVRSWFGDELGKRDAKVQTVIQRTNVGGRLMPPLLEQEEPTEADYDENDPEFAPVETLADTPHHLFARTGSDEGREFTGHANQVTPPPFGTDSHHSDGDLQSVRLLSGSGSVQAVTAARPRSLIWPMLAIAMVGVAGGALFLVWKQTQQPPAVVNITSASAAPSSGSLATTGSASPRLDAAVPADSAAPPAVDDATATAHAATDGSGADFSEEPDRSSARPLGGSTSRRDRRIPPRPANPYTDALRASQASVNKCAQQHGAPTAVKATLVVAVTGRAKSIALEPGAVESTPLGTCIKNVLSASSFPKADNDVKVSVTFNPKI